MKKILNSIAVCCSVLLILASCDKIEKDDYLAFSGATGTWYDSPVTIDNTQRAFLEKYTGVQCKNCPAADRTIHQAMEKYGDRLIVASVHYSDAFATPIRESDPDLRTDKGTQWGEYFIGKSAISLPKAMLNRQQAGGTWATFNPKNSFDDKVDAILEHNAPIGMMMTAEEGSNGFFTNVHIQFFEDFTDKDLTLTVLAIEDDIHTTQIDDNTQLDDYQQNHVMRDVITDVWGLDVNADGKVGTKRMIRLQYFLPDDCKSENCKMIAFISIKDTKEIINSVQCDITSPFNHK